jgi:hypothetical protein
MFPLFGMNARSSFPGRQLTATPSSGSESERMPPDWHHFRALQRLEGTRRPSPYIWEPSNPQDLGPMYSAEADVQASLRAHGPFYAPFKEPESDSEYPPISRRSSITPATRSLPSRAFSPIQESDSEHPPISTTKPSQRISAFTRSPYSAQISGNPRSGEIWDPKEKWYLKINHSTGIKEWVRPGTPGTERQP